MAVGSASFCILRTVVLGLALAFFVTPVLSQTIQPCEATPSPAKPAITSGTKKVGAQTSQTVVDASIANDPAVEKLLAPYTEKVRQLTLVIGRLEGELKTRGVGANSMGHFVVNGMMVAAKAKLGSHVDLVITNAGGLRKSAIQPGDLRASDIFELLPFENALVKLELTGSQLLTLLQRVTAGRDAQAGARIQFRWNEQSRPEFISAKLLDAAGNEREIDPAKTYVVVTIDYLMKLSSGNYAILQDGKNVTPLNITIRDAVIDYVKSESAAGRAIRSRLDGRFVQVGPDPQRTEDDPND